MRRFILVDPCLGDRGSHPYQCCLDVLGAAARAGFACEAVVRREFPADPGDWPVAHGLERSLDISGYSKYTAFGELDTLRENGSPRPRLAVPWAVRHADRRREAHIAAFARAVAPVVGRAAAGDIVLLATASELDVAGLARAIRAAGAAGVRWHALFHYPIYRGLAVDFPRQERRVDRLRGLFAEAIAVAASARIHLHVTTEELAAQYERLGIGPVHVLPYPVRRLARAARTGDGRPLRIVALGDARPEKGSQHLADVVTRAAAEPALAGQITFAVQSNLGFVPRWRNAHDHAVMRSLGRLAGMQRVESSANKLVEMIPGPLTGDEYLAQIAAADATLLAYDQDRYRCRCSGVLLESLAAGVVPIVSGGGSMARLLADPMRRHVESLVAGSRVLATERHGPIRAGHTRPWRIAVEPPASATVLVVTLRFKATGPEALLAVPAAVELSGAGAKRSAAIVAADAAGVGTAAVLPLGWRSQDAGPLTLRVTPAGHASALDLAELSVLAIDSGDRPPVGAAGIVVPPAADVVAGIVEALREFTTHADHYVATAGMYAAEVADRFSGTRVVESLMAVGESWEQVVAEAYRG